MLEPEQTHHKFHEVHLHSKASVTPKILPAHVLLTGHVATVKPDIGCFIFNLHQSFLDKPILTFLAIHVFFTHAADVTNLAMPVQ